MIDDGQKQSGADQNVTPQPPQGVFIIGGEKKEISPNAITSSGGADEKKLIEALKNATEKGIFSEPESKDEQSQ